MQKVFITGKTDGAWRGIVEDLKLTLDWLNKKV
jgi:hypothetical protein